jgi:hypothetical protein
MICLLEIEEVEPAIFIRASRLGPIDNLLLGFIKVIEKDHIIVQDQEGITFMPGSVKAFIDSLLVVMGGPPCRLLGIHEIKTIWAFDFQQNICDLIL